MSEEITQSEGLSRRNMLRLGAAGGVGVALTGATIGAPFLEKKGLLTPDGAFGASGTGLGDSLFYIEAFPTSPLILAPFKDPLVVPKALRPEASATYKAWAQPPDRESDNRTHWVTSSTSSGRARRPGAPR